MNELLAMQGLNEPDKILFLSRYDQEKKSKLSAFLFTFFLGGFGAHRYYMGEVGKGVLYTLFFWTFIPGFIAFIELFLISGRVDTYNMKRAVEISAALKSLSAAKSA